MIDYILDIIKYWVYEYIIIGDIHDPYFFLPLWLWHNDYWFYLPNTLFKFTKYWV